MLACDLIVEVRATRSIGAEQVAELERLMPSGAEISHEMLDFLFAVDRYAERAAPAWTQLLARAVLSGLVLAEAPSGVLTEAKADWLIERIGNDRVADMRNLELVARVMARSEAAPDWLRQMLVELSSRNHSARPMADAPALQAVLAEPLQERPPPDSAEIVPLPDRAAPATAAAAAA
jgi:hypothetical protein